jgi:hypothetical protein
MRCTEPGHRIRVAVERPRVTASENTVDTIPLTLALMALMVLPIASECW